MDPSPGGNRARAAPSELIVPLPTTSFEWSIENRVGASLSQLVQVDRLLTLAERQRCASSLPTTSKFTVGAAGLVAGASEGAIHERICSGANYEVSDDALHGEDTLIADMLGRYGSAARLELVAVTTVLPVPACSCGRCRGKLQAFAGGDWRDLILASGTSARTATLWRLGELLPENFPSIEETRLSEEDRTLLRAAEQSSESGVQLLTEQVDGREGAAVRRADGTIVNAARVNLAAFYGSSALESLVLTSSALGVSCPKAIAYCSPSGLPRPEERQWLYEFANLFGLEEQLPVFLLSQRDRLVRVATPASLLPFAFGITHVRPECTQSNRLGNAA